MPPAEAQEALRNDLHEAQFPLSPVDVETGYIADLVVLRVHNPLPADIALRRPGLLVPGQILEVPPSRPPAPP